MRGRPVLLVLAVSLLLASGCSNSDDRPSPPATAAPEPTTTQSSSSPTVSTSAGTPSGGTSTAPAPVTPTTRLLRWTELPGPVEDSVTTNGTWSLTVPKSGTSYTLTGPDGSTSAGAPGGLRIGDALMDSRWAVVVGQDPRENAQKADVAQVIDLSSQKTTTVDDHSTVPTTTGGTWALGGDTLVHATDGPHGSYCLATVDLTTGQSTRGWCVPPRHGFNAAHITPAGTTVLSFDAGRPSCRTVGRVEGAGFTPFPGVADCTAWEGVLLGADSAVWSVIPKENRVETADVQARVGSAYFDLGPGVSGTLVACHGAAYFARDQQRDDEPASLMRWDGHDLAVVYQAPPGQSFLEAPRCGDTAITVSALSEGGDQQVTAPLS